MKINKIHYKLKIKKMDLAQSCTEKKICSERTKSIERGIALRNDVENKEIEGQARKL